MAACENEAASGRYYGVYDSWHWRDIYAELNQILPDMAMPAPLTEPPVAPTGFDVPLRDIPTMLRQTVEWLKSEPFGGQKTVLS